MSKLAATVPLVLLATVAACASTGPPQSGRSVDPMMISGTLWQWEATITPSETLTSPTPERYTLRLEPDGRVHARFDCNRGSGTFSIGGTGQIRFGSMATTRMACPPESLDRRFAHDLDEVKGYYVEGDRLYLELPVTGGAMRFPRAD